MLVPPLCFHSTAMNWNKGGPGVKRGFGFGGFSLAGRKEEPSLPQKSHTTFGGPPGSSGYGRGQQLPSFYKIGTKRANFDEENAWVLHLSHTYVYTFTYVQCNSLSVYKVICGIKYLENCIFVIFNKVFWRWWGGIQQQCGSSVHPSWELAHTAADAVWWWVRQWRWPTGCLHGRGWGEKRIILLLFYSSIF